MDTQPALKRIIYIDDDPDDHKYLQTRLETELCVTVDCVATSAGAEKMLNERCYDLVISDVSLRGEIGIRILQRLREQDPDQPVLLLTNYDHRDKVIADAQELNLPLASKLERQTPEFIALVRQLLEARPCNIAEPGITTSGARKLRGPPAVPRRRIYLTSPLVTAARHSA